MFILLLIFIAWMVFTYIQQDKQKKSELEQKKYWASPEGLKEMKRRTEEAEKASRWLKYLSAVRSFIKRNQWCWSCKAPIILKINTAAPLYFNNKQEEEQFHKELFRIVCSRCYWVICDNCRACGCTKKLK